MQHFHFNIKFPIILSTCPTQFLSSVHNKVYFLTLYPLIFPTLYPLTDIALTEGLAALPNFKVGNFFLSSPPGKYSVSY
jgi:hypothetical protein